MKKNIFKSTWTYFIIILIIIAGIYTYKNITKEPIGPGQYDEFAQYLTEQGVIMYGTEWCPHCQNNKKLFGNSTTGFTLVEILVALAIFGIIISTTTGLLFSSIIIQRNALASQVLADQMSFVAEYISRAARQAEKDLTGPAQCLTSGTKLNYEVLGGGQIFRFLDKNNICREFSFDAVNEIIQERRSLNHTNNFGAYIPLTSDDIRVNNFAFFVTGAPQAVRTQPRVTFFIDATTKSQKSEGQVSIQLQTSISQRRFDVVE